MKDSQDFGSGTISYDNGTSYKGEWENDEMYGKNTMTHTDGKTSNYECFNGKFTEITL